MALFFLSARPAFMHGSPSGLAAGDGLTRAFVALFHGDLERSQTFHAGAPVVVVVLLVFWARAALSLARR